MTEPMASAPDLLRLIDQAGQWVVALDAGERVAWASGSLADLAGRPLAELVADRDLPAVRALLAGPPAGPLVVRFGVHGQWLSVALTAVPTADGWLVNLCEAPAGARDSLEEGDLAPAASVENPLASLLTGRPRTGVLTAVARCAPTDGAGLLDRAGRLAVEQTLRSIAARLGEVVRGGDVVARGQGDDLVVLLRGVQDLASAVMVAEKLCAAGAQAVPVSVGVTLVQPGESLASVLSRAQGALDMALDAGAGQVVSSPPLPR